MVTGEVISFLSDNHHNEGVPLGEVYSDEDYYFFRVLLIPHDLKELVDPEEKFQFQCLDCGDVTKRGDPNRKYGHFTIYVFCEECTAWYCEGDDEPEN